MAEDLMRRAVFKRSQSGFTMVEMLMAAFVLAIGLLGLTALQSMAISSARGGRNLTTATQLAEHIMDRVEMEARLSYLNVTNSPYVDVKDKSVKALTLKYINQAQAVAESFNIKGRDVDPKSADPIDKAAYFTSACTQKALTSGTIGTTSDFTVVVTWYETINQATKESIPRTVQLTRRYVHG